MTLWERAMKQLGKQPRRYKFFFLNPYKDVRFSYCPKCQGKTKLRKVPLAIQMQPVQLVAVNKSCRYCPACDLLIAHQDEVEEQLASKSGPRPQALIGNSYLIMGTMERADWQRSCTEPMTPAQLQECLYGFKQVLKFEPSKWIKLNVEWKLTD